MGTARSTVTQTPVVPGLDPAAAAAIQQYMDMADSLMQQTGDMSQIAQGGVPDINPDIRASILEAQRLSQEQAQVGLEDSIRQASQQVADIMGQRGMDQSSIEAVNQAIAAQNQQQQVANSILQGQVGTQQALTNAPFQQAQNMIATNSDLYRLITGAMAPSVQAGMQQQQLGVGMEQVSQTPWVQQLMSLGSGLGSSYLSRPAAPTQKEG
jgi:hypothetical protein